MAEQIWEVQTNAHGESIELTENDIWRIMGALAYEAKCRQAENGGKRDREIEALDELSAHLSTFYYTTPSFTWQADHAEADEADRAYDVMQEA